MEGKLRAVLFPNLIHRAGKKNIFLFTQVEWVGKVENSY